MTSGDYLKVSLDALDLQIPPEVRERLLTFCDELLHWNRKVNLTAIRDPDEAIEKHLVDSLTLLPFVKEGEVLVDLGSGGGFPGIPLAIARPGLRVLSVDAVAKKIAFQRHVARLLLLANLEAWHGRAEEVPSHLPKGEGADLVVSRAFSSLVQFVRLALPYLKPSGRMIAMKGPEGEQEVAEALAELADLGVACGEVNDLILPKSGARRKLIHLGLADTP